MKMERKRWYSLPPALVILTLLILLPLSSCSQSERKYLTFKDDTTEKFNHITVQETTDRIYIGANNRIYQLSSNMHLQATADMGPQDDSPECPVTRVCPDKQKAPTDYYNKILQISSNKLIACGSLFQGICTQHSLDDVSTYKIAANVSVAANDATSSTVAFIAPGPHNFDALYVGVTFTNHGHYSLDVPAVSSRILDPTDILTVLSHPSGKGTRMYVSTMYREIYPITYIYGFSSDGFSYFVTVQQSESNPETYISKLVRLCQNDDQYDSYTEVPLSCKVSDESGYNLAQAAYVEKPGSELAQLLGISENDDVLFAVFAKSGDIAANKPTQNSALCLYPMPAVRRKFAENIEHCFRGKGSRGLRFLTSDQPCYPTLLEIEDDFCGIDLNAPLGGTMPVEGAPVLSFPGTLLTAVAVASTRQYTVALLGTSTGHLKKVVVESSVRATEYDDIVIEEGSPVNADLVFDNAKDHIYVMTQKMVTKVKVQECKAFQTCTDCLSSGDPFCGWCLLEEKCLMEKACGETDHDSSCWLPYRSGRCHEMVEASNCTAARYKTTQEGAEISGYRMNVENLKLTSLQDIARSMKSIDNSLKELVALKKQRK